MEALGINLGYLLVFALSFGIMFVVVRAWVFKPLLGMLEKRRMTIARGLEDARVAAEARANAEREASRIIEEAQARAAEIIREATDRAGKVEQEIRHEAEAEVARAREAALAELQGERDQMLSELRGQIVSLAMAAAQKLVSDNLDANRQRALVNEFFSGVRSGKVSILEDVALNGGQSAEVISALPLTIEEQETVRSEILSKLGGAATVSFRTDPSILGGLVVRIGDRVIDGSMASRLKDLERDLR
ncbi:MAG: F0F1 ATP synthase subunit B [Chloroflexi bacterium]|nr:F0F1 ATP synthase subunit B [Chloroflexota bacterium]